MEEILTKSHDEVFDLTTLRNTMWHVVGLTLANIPVASARESVIAKFKSISYQGTFTIFSKAKIVELCTEMESDTWFQYAVLNMTDRLATQLVLLDKTEQVEKIIDAMLEIRLSYKEKGALLDKRITAPVGLSPSEREELSMVISSNHWLVTIWLLALTGAIHFIDAVNQKQ